MLTLSSEKKDDVSASYLRTSYEPLTLVQPVKNTEQNGDIACGIYCLAALAPGTGKILSKNIEKWNKMRENNDHFTYVEGKPVGTDVFTIAGLLHDIYKHNLRPYYKISVFSDKDEILDIYNGKNLRHGKILDHKLLEEDENLLKRKGIELNYRPLGISEILNLVKDGKVAIVKTPGSVGHYIVINSALIVEHAESGKRILAGIYDPIDGKGIEDIGYIQYTLLKYNFNENQKFTVIMAEPHKQKTKTIIFPPSLLHSV
ncbi:MAG: hypothetical protein ACP5TL_02980 [Candidatus Micrarchaeia archaeon]